MAAERPVESRATAVAQKMSEGFRRRYAEATKGAPAPSVEWEFWGRKLADQLSDPSILVDWDFSRIAEGNVILKLKKGQLQDRAQLSVEDLEAPHPARVLTSVRAAYDRLLRLGTPRSARWEAP